MVNYQKYFFNIYFHMKFLTWHEYLGYWVTQQQKKNKKQQQPHGIECFEKTWYFGNFFKEIFLLQHIKKIYLNRKKHLEKYIKKYFLLGNSKKKWTIRTITHILMRKAIQIQFSCGVFFVVVAMFVSTYIFNHKKNTFTHHLCLRKRSCTF